MGTKIIDLSDWEEERTASALRRCTIDSMEESVDVSGREKGQRKTNCREKKRKENSHFSRKDIGSGKFTGHQPGQAFLDQL